MLSHTLYNVCDYFQSLLQTAHDVELRKVKEIEKLKRQVKFLTAEEAANLVIIIKIVFLFVKMAISLKKIIIFNLV